MSVHDALLQSRKEKELNGLKAPREVTRMTLDKTEANPGETLYVQVPKLN